MPNSRLRGGLWAGEVAWLSLIDPFRLLYHTVLRLLSQCKVLFFWPLPTPPPQGIWREGEGGVAKKKGGTYVSVGVCWSVDRVCMHIAFQTTRLPRGSREYNYFPAPVPGAPRKVCTLLFYHRRILVTTNTGIQTATGETCPSYEVETAKTCPIVHMSTKI